MILKLGEAENGPQKIKKIELMNMYKEVDRQLEETTYIEPAEAIATAHSSEGDDKGGLSR